MTIRTILVDDEPLATQGLQLRLQALRAKLAQKAPRQVKHLLRAKLAQNHLPKIQNLKSNLVIA